MYLLNSNSGKYYCCEEKDLLDEVEDDFSYQVKERGIDYYNSGNIVLCCKNNNKYYAKVCRKNEKLYIVNVEITKDVVAMMNFHKKAFLNKCFFILGKYDKKIK